MGQDILRQWAQIRDRTARLVVPAKGRDHAEREKGEPIITGMNRRSGQMRQTATVEMRFDEGNAASSNATRPSAWPFWLPTGRLRSNFVVARLARDAKIAPNRPGIRGMAVRSRPIMCLMNLPYKSGVATERSPLIH